MTQSPSSCSSHTSPVTLTPKAAFHVREIAHSMEKEGGLVRIQAHPEAREEQRYELEFVERASIDARDSVHWSEGVELVLDEATAAYMQGTVMDFVQGMWEAGFRFENPNLVQWTGNSLAQTVQSVLEAKVLPILKSHGGEHPTARRRRRGRQGPILRRLPGLWPGAADPQRFRPRRLARRGPRPPRCGGCHRSQR